jgi:hypothetical protein
MYQIIIRLQKKYESDVQKDNEIEDVTIRKPSVNKNSTYGSINP